MTSAFVSTRSRLHSLRLRPRLVLAALAAFLVAFPLVFLALAVRTGWAPLRRIDHGIAEAVHREVSAHGWAVWLGKAGDVVLHPWVFRVAVLGLVIALIRRKAIRLAWWAGITMAVGSVLGFTLKLAMARARPELADPVAHAPGYSFPSGHALNSAVGVLVLLLAVLPALPGVRTRIAAWVAGLTVIALAGLDRIALGVHYLSDVVAAWVVAAALVAATAAAFETWRRDVGAPPHDPLEGVDPEDARRLA
ncbi:phosphatase PAP2 family protein [Virgisporangium aliadipatigenens]|nr:phosphatase PAP2 family protein [Virgisporangium aliadipatigenens]